MFGIKKHIMDMILSEISDHKEICDVIIFGSRAKGNFKKGSDIDIALKGENISFELVAGLQTRFNQEMPVPHHVDLVHYESISNQDLINHIDRVASAYAESCRHLRRSYSTSWMSSINSVHISYELHNCAILLFDNLSILFFNLSLLMVRI